MKVFKFGGASVRDANAVRNLAGIVRSHHPAPFVIVVSAMGKSTNELESILSRKWSDTHFQDQLNKFEEYHLHICSELFSETNHPVFEKVSKLFQALRDSLKTVSKHFEKDHDQIVSFGELISTTIVQTYLNHTRVAYKLVDAREIIITDSNYGEGRVRWDLTTKAINDKLNYPADTCFLTQGFIGADDSGNTVTLGREGSDYTAAIIAHCLEADSVTIWKDVPGVLNADPSRWNETTKYEVISYGEAAEMTYYGASVIHPKTIRPLAVKKIPLIVKSFQNPEKKGTRIADVQHEALEPAVIFKPNQCLISFQVCDFSFINESKISLIFHLFEEFNIQVNMMQSSAISFSVCVDNPDDKMKNIINSLSAEFDIFYNDQLELITIKNYRQELVDRITRNQEVLLEQRTRRNFQALIYKPTWES